MLFSKIWLRFRNRPFPRLYHPTPRPFHHRFEDEIMSLPSQPPLLSPSELQKFEAPLIALANLSGGDLRKLFYAFFSFLNRRTDFYCILPDEPTAGGQRQMGFREGQAEQILIASFRQFPLRKMGDKKTSGVGSTKADVNGTATATKTPEPSQKATEVAVEEPKKTSDENNSDDSKPKSPDTKAPKADPERKDATETPAKQEGAKKPKGKSQSAVRYTDEGKQVPVGNGGSTTRYVWTQTLEEVVVHVPVPEGTRAKDLNVEIAPTSLSIKRKESASDAATDFDPLSGTLFARVKPSESTWTMETNSSSESKTTTILLTLDKVQKTWWSTILSGDPEIDNSMVDSTRHIGTYDEKTQAQIRRIMFDQRQERLGLPTSENLAGKPMEMPTRIPEGVEVINQETLDKAGAIGKAG